MDLKSLIIYFSRADENYGVGYIEKGNTEVLAEYIEELTGAKSIKIEPELAYPKDYEACLEEAKNRQESHHAPIKRAINDFSDYQIIYIGAPVYYGFMPEEMVTALQNLDFTGKVIMPFVTHEGSGKAFIPDQIKTICKNALVKPGLSIRGSKVREAKDEVAKWLNN